MLEFDLTATAESINNGKTELKVNEWAYPGRFISKSV